MTKITVLTKYQSIPNYYSLYPFLKFNSKDISFKYTNSIRFCLNRDSNSFLIVLRHDVEMSDNSLVKKLKEKYKTITFFDDSDSSRETPKYIKRDFDYILKGSKLKNSNHYLFLEGKRITEFYYNNGLSLYKLSKQKIMDDNRVISGWNLAFGIYPVNWKLFRLGNFLAPFFGLKRSVSFLEILLPTKKKYEISWREKKYIHAIFSYHSRDSINFQRRLSHEILKNHSFVIATKTKQKDYYKILNKSRIVISPFGWGEICFRDYEAIYSKALLFKPDVSHLDDPFNIFEPFETYIPLKWDMSDLAEKIDYYYSNQNEYTRITNNALSRMKKSIGYRENYVEKVINIITGE